MIREITPILWNYLDKIATGTDRTILLTSTQKTLYAMRANPKITFVVGLPGSGKSTWMKQQKAQGNDVHILDDFKANAHNDDPAFCSSRYLSELKAAVESGRDIFIADIDFCRSASRIEADLFVTRNFPEATVRWIFFEKSIISCKENVRRDHERDVDSRLAKIDEFEPQYQIPSDATCIPVWSP